MLPGLSIYSARPNHLSVKLSKVNANQKRSMSVNHYSRSEASPRDGRGYHTQELSPSRLLTLKRTTRERDKLLLKLQQPTPASASESASSSL